MDVVIKELSPELLNDYLYFFENVAHTDNKEWDRCYCLNYCSDDQSKIKGYTEFDADARRKYAVEYVKSGIIKGYLAYINGQVAGWCNVNDKKDCHKCFGNFFIYGNTKIAEDDSKILSLFCFTVAPDFRGKHIATMLLNRVIDDAKKRGYDYIEGYPEKGEVDQYYNYCGPEKLYKNAGFTLWGSTEKRNIMRKKL